MKDSSIIQNSKSSLNNIINFTKEVLTREKILPESKCTHLVRNVEFARPVEIEDGVEGTWMSGGEIIFLRLISDKCQAAAPVEEELVVDEAVV